MTFASRVTGWTLVLLASGPASVSAVAETKLTDFNGTWQGDGDDRNTPFEPTQHTKCTANISADLHRMSTGITCNGVDGLGKVIQLNIALSGGGDAFSGDLTQKATILGDSSTPTVLNGSVFGQKTDKTANFKVSFPGFTPSVYVTLTLNSPSSFSMQVNTLGSGLMDVTFNRTSKP